MPQLTPIGGGPIIRAQDISASANDNRTPPTSSAWNSAPCSPFESALRWAARSQETLLHEMNNIMDGHMRPMWDVLQSAATVDPSAIFTAPRFPTPSVPAETSTATLANAIPTPPTISATAFPPRIGQTGKTEDEDEEVPYGNYFMNRPQTGIQFPPPFRALGQPPASTLKYSETSSVTAIPSNLAMVPAPPPPPHPRRNAPPPPRSSALSEQRPRQSDAIPPMPQGPPPPDYDATDSGTGHSENGDVTPTLSQQNIGHQSGTFRSKPLMNWTVADVCDWLDSMDLSEYKRAFSRSNVDGHLLSNCDRTQFTQLGVTRIPHQIVMENSLEEYKTET